MAGIQIATGFDSFTTPTHFFNSVALTNGTAAIGSFGRNSSNALRFTQGNNLAAASLSAAKTLPTAVADAYQAFAFMASSLPPAGQNWTIAQFRDAGTVQCSLHLMSDGTIRVFRGATLLLSSSGFAALPNVFYHIEWRILVHPSTGSVQVWVNEIPIISQIGNQNTRGSANEIITEALLALATSGNSIGGTTLTFDDFIVRDDQQIGDKNVREDLPTGTGSTDQWTAQGAASTREAVDDNPPNEDTDYAHTSTVGHISLWTYPAIPTDSEVDAVILSPRAKKTDAGTAQIQSVARVGGTNYNGASKAPSQDGYEYHPHVFMNSPDTSSPWTPSEVNGSEYGVERTA